MIIVKIKKSGGMFAQIFCQILNILENLEKYDIYPYFEIESKCYGIGECKQFIPYYLVHNYDYKTNNNKKINSNFLELCKEGIIKKDNDNIQICFKFLYKKLKKKINLNNSNRLFFKYFDISKDIKYEINEILKKEFNGFKILGLHYRSTDKMKPNSNHSGYKESYYFDDNDTISIIKNEIKINNYNKLFIATDDRRIIEKIKQHINIKIFSYIGNFTRLDGICLHNNKLIKSDNDRYQMGKSAIIDSFLLSNCNFVLKYCSMLSAFSLIINPNLKINKLNKPNYNWFPENLIKNYTTEKNNL